MGKTSHLCSDSRVVYSIGASHTFVAYRIYMYVAEHMLNKCSITAMHGTGCSVCLACISL